MRLSLTDKFLWDLYNTLGKVRAGIDAFDPYGHSIHRLILPNTPLGKKYSRQQFSKFVSYLKKKGYIKVANLKTKTGVMITKEGLKKILVVGAHTENRKKRKDGKWLMVMFDIPEKRSGHRDLLRSILQNLGFQKFQNSVWVTPYDVLDATETLIARHSLDEYVKIFVIEKIH